MTTVAESEWGWQPQWQDLPWSSYFKSHLLPSPNEDEPFPQHKSDADEDERPISADIFSNDTP